MTIRRISLALAGLALALLAAPDGGAAVFTVTTDSDSGAGSLREAITLAEANGEADEILLGARTINLASQLPDVTTQITVRGEGWAHSVIDGGNSPGGSDGVRAFFVDTSGVLVLDGVDIANCYSSGVLSNGSVTVIDSRFANNRAAMYGGAIDSAYSGGTITLQDSTFTGNEAGGGGAVMCWSSDLHATGCTFSDNAAYGPTYPGYGGAIAMVGNVQADLTNCTFYGNHADRYGGALWMQAGNTVTIDGVTIAANTAGLGGTAIYFYDYSSMSVVMSHTIVAGTCGSDYGALPTSAGHNLETGDTCGLVPGLGDLVNTDPQLQPLQDWGGPTATCGLADSSPAIDAGDPACGLVMDQRGMVRPVDGDADGSAACDIGAVEHQGMVFWDGFEGGDWSRWSGAVGG